MNWLKRLLGWESEAAEESGAEPIEEADEWGDEDFPKVIEMPVEDFLDLHHFPPKEIPDVVDAYLQEAVGKGFTEVRLIHGRGKGVQRRRVQSLLSRHPRVLSFRDAPVERGGWGATIALLKKPSSRAKRVVVDAQVLEGDDLSKVIEPLHWSVDIYNGPEAYERSLAVFSAGQRGLFAIDAYRMEVNNGGHSQFYFNSTGIVWKDALDGFRAAGLDAFADVLLRSVRRFGGDPPLDRERRQGAFEGLKPLFKDLDELFYKLESQVDLDQELLAFARGNPEQFYFDEVVRLPR